MKKNTVKLLCDIVTNEFDNTRDFLLTHKNSINNSTLKRYVLNIRNNIITQLSINKDIILTQKEKEIICKITTINITTLLSLINKCSENMSPYCVSIYINTTRDMYIKGLYEYYCQQTTDEIIDTFNHLVELVNALDL